VGNHHNARAFEDLAEFLDHFLFLGSIHSFTPRLGVSPRLMFAPSQGRRVRNGSRAKITRKGAFNLVPHLGQDLWCLRTTHRLGQNRAERLLSWPG
jgi:hypothetical protein